MPELKEVLIIDPMNYTYHEGQVYKQIVDDFYYKSPFGPIPIAYCLDPTYQHQIERGFKILSLKKKELNYLESKIFYKEFTNYRI